MELGLKKYAISTAILFALLAAVLAGCVAVFSFSGVSVLKVVLLAAVFYVVCLLGILLLRHFAKKGGMAAVNGYMAVRGIKLALLAGILLVLLMLDRASATWTAGFFLLFYAAMLIFDTIYFSRKMKR